MELTGTSTTTTTTTVFGLSKTLNHSQILRSQLTPLHVRRPIASAKAEFRRPLVRYRLACFSSSTVSFASGGGGGVNGGGGDGGGGDGGEVKADPIVVGADDGSSDVIILDVRGMSCGGCSSKVKRILESQPLVSAANVNLKTETAIVWIVPTAKVTPNWQKDLGEELAKHLTTCGFNSNLRVDLVVNEDWWVTGR